MLNYKKIITVGLLALAPLASMAGTGKFVPGIDGAYRGKFKGQRSGKVHFVAKAINGCDGCFIATIFKYRGDIQAKIYKALPLNSEWSESGNATASEYSLTPIGVDPTDGEITTISEANIYNDNPSMRLTIRRHAGEDNVKFSIVEAGSNNMDPFASAMNFDGDGSRFDVEEDGFSGKESEGRFRSSVGTIGQFSTSQEDQVTRFATISSFGDKNNKSGTFDLEEKAPGLFTYTSVGLFSYGEQLADLPKKIVVFIEKNSLFGGRERAFLINPSNSADVDELQIR